MPKSNPIPQPVTPAANLPFGQVAPQPVASTFPNFDEMPDSGLVRQAQLVRDPKHPTRPTPLPFSPATFWRKVKNGSFPQPVKLGARVTAWRVEEVRAWILAQE